MAGREWMYTGWTEKRKSVEWVHGTNQFLQQAFGPAAHGSDRTLCPCKDYKNQKRKVEREVYKDLVKHGFVENYERWIFHGEAKATVREEEVRACLKEFDGDVGVVDMVVDYNEARGNEGLVEEDPEETAKAFYEMMSSAQKPLREKTTMSQLDAIGRVENTGGVRDAQEEIRICQGEGGAVTPPREPLPWRVHGHMDTLHTDLFIYSFIESFILITCNHPCVFLADPVA
jgi:hypothetical protein